MRMYYLRIICVKQGKHGGGKPISTCEVGAVITLVLRHYKSVNLTFVLNIEPKANPHSLNPAQTNPLQPTVTWLNQLSVAVPSSPAQSTLSNPAMFSAILKQLYRKRRKTTFSSSTHSYCVNTLCCCQFLIYVSF